MIIAPILFFGIPVKVHKNSFKSLCAFFLKRGFTTCVDCVIIINVKSNKQKQFWKRKSNGEVMNMIECIVCGVLTFVGLGTLIIINVLKTKIGWSFVKEEN